MDLELSQDDDTLLMNPRLGEDVVMALLRNKIGDDVRIHKHALKMMTEYLRLITQETIDRSIAAARQSVTEGGEDGARLFGGSFVEKDVIHVEPTHVSQIVQQLLLDV
mmetsp:Transcript_17594/g.34603  ORF Transcript_17594/g.34603 Transcript_17594/m.34603 type:complete len:108 (+) Transcript_17594:68-391(+)